MKPLKPAVLENFEGWHRVVVVGDEEVPYVSTPVNKGDVLYVGKFARYPFCTLCPYWSGMEFSLPFAGTEGFLWTSTNAAFQAIWNFDPCEWRHFAAGGMYAKLDENSCNLLNIPLSEIDVKHRWGRKGDYSMKWDGYMADLVVKHARNCLQGADDAAGVKTLKFQARLWEEITYERMNADWRARNALLSTGTRVLVQLNRFAEFDVKRGAVSRVLWGGCVSDQDDRLYGANLMGRVLMRVRDRLMKETAPTPKMQMKIAHRLYKEAEQDHEEVKRWKRKSDATTKRLKDQGVTKKRRER